VSFVKRTLLPGWKEGGRERISLGRGRASRDLLVGSFLAEYKRPWPAGGRKERSFRRGREGDRPLHHWVTLRRPAKIGLISLEQKKVDGVRGEGVSLRGRGDKQYLAPPGKSKQKKTRARFQMGKSLAYQAYVSERKEESPMRRGGEGTVAYSCRRRVSGAAACSHLQGGGSFVPRGGSLLEVEQTDLSELCALCPLLLPEEKPGGGVGVCVFPEQTGRMRVENFFLCRC